MARGSAGALAAEPEPGVPKRSMAPGGAHEQGQGNGLRDRAVRWRRALLGRSNSPEEQHPFSSWDGQLNEPNQRVIHADCERTRAEVEHFRRPEVRAKMEAMLTCWCQQQKAKYKQGLNEVLAPFLYLQSEPGEGSPSDDEVFACFGAFLKRFAPFFDSDDFVPLQCAFVFFRRLLLYHRPDLHNLLVERGVSPDMFCMPWFLTLFASKTPLRLTLQLWDRHLERGEPPFFVFLAAAVLANAEAAVLSAERSQLPEILTSLGPRSFASTGLGAREELEALWSAAEGLYSRTPATFAARLRRNVLRVGAARGKNGSGQKGEEEERHPDGLENPPGGLLEKLEQERCFFILPEEVVAHCYPIKAGEPRKPWQPSPACPWRLLVLDLRPRGDFEAARLPAALHFDPFASLQGSAHGPWATGRRLLQWGLEPAGAGLEPPRVFEALKATLGEDWVCDREAHICLLGAASDAAVVRSLYEVLTAQLTYWHVSVASGGFEAVVECARKQGYEIIRSSDSVPVQAPGGEKHPPPTPRGSNAAATAVASARAAAESEANRWGEKFASAWTNLKRAAGTAAASHGGGGGRERFESFQSEASAPAGERASVMGPSVRETKSSSTGPPRLSERPGNWPPETSLALLPTRPCSELLLPGLHWDCLAVVVRLPELFGLPRKPAGTALPWEGCPCVLTIANGLLFCSGSGGPERAPVLAEFEISRVLKVTSKKQAPEVLIFYFHEDPPPQGGTGGPAEPAPSADPAMVLHFARGTEDVRAFIRALRGTYSDLPGEPSAEAAVPPDSAPALTPPEGQATPQQPAEAPESAPPLVPWTGVRRGSKGKGKGLPSPELASRPAEPDAAALSGRADALHAVEPEEGPGAYPQLPLAAPKTVLDVAKEEVSPADSQGGPPSPAAPSTLPASPVAHLAEAEPGIVGLEEDLAGAEQEAAAFVECGLQKPDAAVAGPGEGDSELPAREPAHEPAHEPASAQAEAEGRPLES